MVKTSIERGTGSIPGQGAKSSPHILKKLSSLKGDTESSLLRAPLRVGSTFPSRTDDSSEQQSDIIQEEDRPV